MASLQLLTAERDRKGRNALGVTVRSILHRPAAQFVRCPESTYLIIIGEYLEQVEFLDKQRSGPPTNYLVVSNEHPIKILWCVHYQRGRQKGGLWICR